MTSRQDFRATATYAGDCPTDLLEQSRSYCDGFGLEVQHAPDRLTVQTGRGTCCLITEGRGFRLQVSGRDKAARQALCDTAMHMIEHVFPGVIGQVRWSSLGREGALPDNVQLAAFVSARRISPQFLRITLSVARVDELRHGGMHFGLLLPPAGRLPQWPRLNADGRTIWPEGADKLHRAAFTFVDLDAANGLITFDLFEHAGGPATDWARTAEAGAPCALSGPGGGEAPKADHLLMMGDETALPAIRHIVAHAGPDARGTLIVETADPHDRILGEVPPGFRVIWLQRGAGETLADVLAGLNDGWAHLMIGAPFVWVAAEQAVARQARQIFLKERAIPRARTYLAAYWSADA